MQSRDPKDYDSFAAFDAAGVMYAKAHFQLGDRVRANVPESERASLIRAGTPAEGTGTLVQSLYADKGDVVDGDGDVAVKWDEPVAFSIGHIPALWLDRETQ